jgi:Holliday junction resolvase RusA-like endonuclease
MRQVEGFETMTPIHIFISGIPKPGGSKRVFLNRRTGRPIVTDDAGKGNKEWKQQVAFFAQQAYTDEPLRIPLRVTFAFVFARPQSHYGSGRNAQLIRASAPEFPAVRPDCTKLVRAAEDALTGILWHDDALIVQQDCSKSYAGQLRPGLYLTVEAARSDSAVPLTSSVRMEMKSGSLFGLSEESA